MPTLHTLVCQLLCFLGEFSGKVAVILCGGFRQRWLATPWYDMAQALTLFLVMSFEIRNEKGIEVQKLKRAGERE